MTTVATCAFGEVSRSPSYYRGEQFDSDLSLYYLRARYYNPLTGRFLSRDPENGNAYDPRTLHKYLYAGGDPVNMADPFGRASMLETGSLDALMGEGPVPALREFAGAAVRLVCTALIWAADWIPPVSGPHMNDMNLLRLFSGLCKAFGY